MNLSSVAWVPDDDPGRDWSIAAALAIEWAEDRCREEGASGVLVTNVLNHLGVPELDAFERRHTRTSRRAGRGGAELGRRPVLSYVPHAEDLEFAMDLARGSSIGAVETIGFPIAGWAAWLNAWNLVTGEPTPPLAKPIKEAIDSLTFYGNNGFGDHFGKRQARSILANLGTQGRQLELIPSALLATGVSAHGVANLRRLIESLG
jgi:hypothetical protein